MKEKIHLLFSYGTLQLERVQSENYGRISQGEKDRLLGYWLESLRIANAGVHRKSSMDNHPIAIKSKYLEDVVEEIIFELTNYEFEETDKYEVSQYQRIPETFGSGKKARVYVCKNNTI